MQIEKRTILENHFIKVTQTLYKSGCMIDAHSHEHTALSLILRGVNQETVNGITRSGTTTQLIIKPEGLVHNNLYSDNCLILCVYLKEFSKKRFLKSGVLEEWNWIESTQSLPFIISLMQCGTEKAFNEILNTFLQHVSIKHKSTVIQEIPEWLLKIKTVLDTNYQFPVRVDNLAKEVNMHRVYVTRAFKKHFGLSIKSYLKITRLHHAASDIIQHQNLASSALRNGFSDQSHLNRKFKEILQMPPGKFQSLIKA